MGKLKTKGNESGESIEFLKLVMGIKLTEEQIRIIRETEDADYDEEDDEWEN
jgi:hypothetical protein